MPQESVENEPPPNWTTLLRRVDRLGAYLGSVSRMGRTAKEFALRSRDGRRGGWGLCRHVVGA